MRCRECGLELDERDRLRNGAYQCPECGTIHHTASSRKASPSPWRGQRRRRPASAADVLQQRLWVLPLWSWAAIVLVVLIAAILLLTLGGHKAAPAEPGAPSVEDMTQNETQEYPEIVASEEDADIGAESDFGSVAQTAPPVSQAAETNGHTGITSNDFLVSFDWAVGNLKYTSALSAPTEGTNSNGEQTLSYDFEDWFNVVLTIDTNSSAIRHAIATATADVSQADNQKMLAGFVTVLYCFDTSLSGSKALSELNAMIADNRHTYGTSSFVAKVDSSNSSYTMDISGKL